MKVPANPRSFLILCRVGAVSGERQESFPPVVVWPGRGENRMNVTISDMDSQAPDTDFDSLFVIGEADQSALVAKQQQQAHYVSRHHHHGSGYNSPNRGSPARRTQVRLPPTGLMMTCKYNLTL